ncbi:PAS domain S-box protein [Sphingomicrobium aestuariivivum]|uniref:PAS domain S-box protein n=1 Tax=Sphingomicrobium aestuariivivum TaxID=1582356 RepID=UPI001FD68138|nr:PAS domain S-box protein [Sphingomicrobium aestuariivivum]MCJ8191218.1 PAS domain S-box protein [Sphingomicrobium aestuariivivum]
MSISRSAFFSRRGIGLLLPFAGAMLPGAALAAAAYALAAVVGLPLLFWPVSALAVAVMHGQPPALRRSLVAGLASGVAIAAALQPAAGALAWLAGPIHAAEVLAVSYWLSRTSENRTETEKGGGPQPLDVSLVRLLGTTQLASLLAAAGLWLVSGGLASGVAALAATFLALSLGHLLLLPPILAGRSAAASAAAPGTDRAARALLILAATLLVLAAFTRPPSLFLLPLVPVLLLASYRLAPAAMMTAILGWTALAAVASAAGMGPIAVMAGSTGEAALWLQLFTASLLLVALPVRALALERDGAAARAATGDRLIRSIAEQSRAAMLHCDAAGRPLWANGPWRDFAGLSDDVPLGDDWLRLLDPSDAVRFDLAWSRALVVKEDAMLDVRVPQGDSIADYRMRIAALVEQDRCTGFLLLLEDRTAQRRDAEALERSERLYRLVAENSRDIIFRLDLEANVLFASSAAERVLGLLPEDLCGQSIRPYVHGNDWPVFTHILSDLLIGAEPPELRFRLRHEDGQWRWVEAMFQLVYHPSGHPREMIATVRDIHRRQLIEDMMTESAGKLRESNRLLTLAEELAQVAHWRFSFVDGGFDHGHQLYRMLGQVPGRLIEARALLRQLDGAARHTLLNAVREARRRKSSVECAVDFSAGEERRHVRIALHADRDPRGEAVGVIGVVRDITEERQAHREIVSARDAARAAARAKAQFLAVMSHEIRTPMTGVIGLIDLLREDGDAVAREANLATLAQSAEELMGILDELLDYWQIEGGHLELEMRDFRVEELVAETLDQHAPAARAKGLSLRLEADVGNPLPARGDAARVRQIFSTLLSNAIKFTAEGEVVVELARRSRIDEQLWTLAVRDSGAGISPAVMERLFEPFGQADSSLSRGAGGAGLGLAMAQRLAGAMGGRIHVESDRHHGSRFSLTLTLPVGEEPVPLPRQEVATGAALDLLVAEDNAVNQMLIHSMLAARGHRVTCVGNGLAAVDAVRGGSFDAVVMDMQMPEMDGIAATRQIRALGGQRGRVPVIALSADASPERRRFYDNVGLDAFLTKPIDRAALFDTLDRLVSASAGVAAELRQGQDEAGGQGAELKARAAGTGDGDGGTPVLLDGDRLEELGQVLGAQRLDNLLGLLRVELELRPGQIARAIADGDLPKVASEAHVLKGAAGSAGAARVAALAARLETAADLDEASLRLAAIERAAEETLAVLGKRENILPPATERRA